MLGVELLELLQEQRAVFHHCLGALPVRLLNGLARSIQQHLHTVQEGDDLGSGCLVVRQLVQVVLVQRVERLQGRLQLRLGLEELLLRLFLSSVDLLLDRIGLFLLDLGLRALFVRPLGLLVQGDEEDFGILLGLVDGDLIDLELGLQVGDGVLGRQQRVGTRLQLVDLLLDIALLLQQQFQVQVDQLQEGLRSCVGTPALRLQELDRDVALHQRVGISHELGDRVDHLVVKLHRAVVLSTLSLLGELFAEVNQEGPRDGLQRIVRPRLEPVDRGAGDQGRELTAASAELIVWRKAHDHVKVLFHLFDEGQHAVLVGIRPAFLLALVAHRAKDFLLLVGREQSCDLSGAQNIV